MVLKSTSGHACARYAQVLNTVLDGTARNSSSIDVISVAILGSSPMSALDVIRGGKHSGSTYSSVADADRRYCHWIINAPSLPRSLRPLRSWLKTTHGGVFCFGKHKHSFYSGIYKDFPEYTIWACEQTDASAHLRDFQQYVRRRDAETASEEASSRQQPDRKRARGRRESEPAATQTFSMECKICFDRPIEVLLLPCKHLVCCQTCGALSSTCPVCRGRVSERIRVYPG